MIFGKSLQKNRGAAMLTFVMFFAFATGAMIFILGQNIFTDLADFNRLIDGKRAYLASESITDDVVYRITFGLDYDNEETFTINGVSTIATTTYESVDDIYTISATAVTRSTIRKSEAIMAIGSGSAFNYGMQAGNGGIDLDQSATVVGNIYSNGAIDGFNHSMVYGSVVSAGPTGFINDIHATGSVFANEISDLVVDQDAHYYTFSGATSTIAGNQYRTPVYQATSTMPLSTTTVKEWKDAITDVESATDPTSVCYGGGTYTIDIDLSIGYTRYECDIEISGNGTDVTLTGPILVEGNLTFSNGPNIKVDPALGRQSVQIMVSSSTNKTTSSQISVAQSTSFEGSGDDRSFIMLYSENESASLGGSEAAISLGNSSEGDLLVYAENGLVDIAQQINLTEVTGYQIDIGNNSSVAYQLGLSSVLFTSGPGGAYVLSDWQQID